MLACAPLAALPVLDAWRAAALEAGDPTDPPPPSGQFRSLRLAGALALQAKRLPAAEQLLHRALALAPLDAESWRLFAAAARAAGDDADQATRLRLAARLTWRDPPTQRRLMLRAFGADNLRAGVAHADALLRLQPDDSFGMAALMTAMDYGDGQWPLAIHLAATPAWRKPFFSGLLVAGDEDARGLVALLRRMRFTAAPPSLEENGIAVAKLIQAGYGPLASEYWREASGRPSGYDFANADPDFAESLPALQAGDPGQPFGWTLNRSASIQVSDGRDSSGRSALTFDGPSDGAGQIVSRYVLLAPGVYTLGYAGSADGRPTDRFRPQIHCTTDGRLLPYDTLRPSDADGYLVSRVALRVPAGCSALWFGFSLAPGEDGQVHRFALRQVHWAGGGA